MPSSEPGDAAAAGPAPAAGARPRRAIGWRGGLLVAGLSLALTAALGLTAGEVYVRATRPHLDLDAIRHDSIEYEPTLFSRHAFPRMLQEKKEDYISERGYKGRSFAFAKPAGTVRIVVLGGSAAYDPYAKPDRDWPRLVQDNLRAKGHANVEVINAGTPGHATWDALGRLYSEIWMFEPDYILIYEEWNDINYFNWLGLDKTLLRGYRPVGMSVPSGAGLLGNPFMYYYGPVDRLLSRSQLYAHARWRFLEWHYGLLGGEGLLRMGAPTGERGTFRKSSADTYSEWGPRQYALNLRLLVDAARNIGATPVLMTQARLTAGGDDEKNPKRIPYFRVGLTPAALDRAFADCDRALASVAKEKGVPFLDLSALFSNREELFVRHVHATAKGSEAFADAVASFLSPMLQTRAAPPARAGS
jgi:lysophospholipase L1-like esterase